jgi:hypothetical protein
LAGGSCACLNPAAGKEFEILQDAEEAVLPDRNVLGLDRRKCARDPTPSVRESIFAQLVISEPVPGLPHMVRNIVRTHVHGIIIQPPWPEKAACALPERAVSVCPRWRSSCRRLLNIWAEIPDLDQEDSVLAYVEAGVDFLLTELRGALLQVFEQTDERPFRPRVTLAQIRGKGRTIARKHDRSEPGAHATSRIDRAHAIAACR